MPTFRFAGMLSPDLDFTSVAAVPPGRPNDTAVHSCHSEPREGLLLRGRSPLSVKSACAQRCAIIRIEHSFRSVE
jgi:hypothetical protein